MRMDHGARRPRSAIYRWERSYHLEGLPRLRAKRAEVVRRRAGVGLVAADDPGARNRILAQFHRSFTLRLGMGSKQSAFRVIHQPVHIWHLASSVNVSP